MTPSKKSRLVATPTLLSPALLFVLVIFTARTLPAQQVDFSKEVLPVLKANCFKCHGEKKAKAKLRLHTLADALKGGKNGGAIAPGKSAESLLIKRISLGKDDDDIMPPEGGPLEKGQIEALKRWIDQGAKWAEGAAGTEAKPAKKINVAELPAAVTDAITKAGGRAMRLAQDTNLVTVSFRAVAGKTGDEQLASLKGAAAVAELNLAGSKVTDAGLANLSGLVNLGRLHLELTGIDGSGLTHLGKLQNLHYLNLYGTKVNDDGIKSLASLKGLKKLYLWQTEVTDAGVEELEKALPGVDVNRGLVAAQVVAVEPSAATPAKKPAPKPPEKAVVVIAQSTDGWSFVPASEIKGEDWLKVAFDDGKWA
ncbi:MAG: c-type cytochrome domain-containing protein, partial [Planctomycetota bacterium]|nr:c-type cytochrome domain-containing protein [Planctomycetota bacterium]